MGGTLRFPATSSKEETSSLRESRGLVNGKAVFEPLKFLLMNLGGGGLEDAYLCFLRGVGGGRCVALCCGTDLRLASLRTSCETAFSSKFGSTRQECRSTEGMCVDRHTVSEISVSERSLQHSSLESSGLDD